MSEKPLKNWGEIAGYLGVSVKTAQRLEKCGLPIHRPVKGAGGRKNAVWAFSSELNEWVRRQEGLIPLELPAQVPEKETSRRPAHILNLLQGSLGPHPFYVLFWSLAYSAFYGTAVVLELVYNIVYYERLALLGGFFSAFGMFAATLISFAWLESLLCRDSRYSLIVAGASLVGAALINVAILVFFIPNQPIVLASIQTYAAGVAYFKDTLYALSVGLILMLPPYALIRSLERRIAKGESSSVMRLLSRDSDVAAPPGVIFLRPWQLGVVFTVLVTGALYLMTHLLDHLTHNEFTWLFQLVLWFRMALFFLLGLATLCWFWTTLNGLKARIGTDDPPRPPKAPGVHIKSLAV